MIHRNGVDGGIIVKQGNTFARSDDGGASWILLVPAVAVTEADLLSWKDNQLVNLQRLTGGVDIRASNDNGATWPIARNAGMGLTGRIALKTTQDDKVLMALGSNGNFAWTSDDDIATATFTSFPNGTFVGFGGGIVGFDANGDSSKGVMIDQFGAILVSIDGFQTWTIFDKDKNYFKNAATGFAIATSVVYVADIGGFLIISNTVYAFIPEDGGLDTMEVVSILGDNQTNNQSATNGIDLMIAASINVVIQLPFKA